MPLRPNVQLDVLSHIITTSYNYHHHTDLGPKASLTILVHVNEFLREYFWLLLFILHLVGILNLTVLSMGALLVAEMVKNPQQCGRPGLDPWVGKIL